MLFIHLCHFPKGIPLTPLPLDGMGQDSEKGKKKRCDSKLSTDDQNMDAGDSDGNSKVWKKGGWLMVFF